MSRYVYHGTMRDGHGHVILGGTVSVYLAGTTTAADVYEASTGGTAVNSVTSSSTDGTFAFYVDLDAYDAGQLFKVVLSKAGFSTSTYDDIAVITPVFTGGLAGKVDLDGSNLALGSDADGDMYYRSGGVLARLPKGDVGQSLVMGAALPAWDDTLAGKMERDGSNLAIGLDADGDIYYRSSGTLTRLPKGTAGHLLTMGADVPGWSALAQVDHGSLGGLSDDDHTQYVKHSLAVSANDFLVGSSGAWGKKTLSETHAILALSHYNYIINGNFDVWQRATSQTSSGYGSADRWSCTHSGSSKTASQKAFTLGQTDVPNEPKYYLRHIVTTSEGAANFCLMNQPIESVRTLAGKTATLSFYAKADATKNIAVTLTQDFGTGGSPSAAVHVGGQLAALTTAWQKITISFTVPSITGKTLGSHGNDNLLLRFWFDAGTNYASASASLGQQSGTFDIAQVQLEEGSVATPFHRRSYGEELVLCQRYYDVITANTRWASAGSSEQHETPIYWHQPMRGTPTTAMTAGTRQNVSDARPDGATYLGARHWVMATAAGSCYALMDLVRADAEI